MTDLTSDDGRWLDAAARYAAPFVGTTADNPTVGALIVDPSSQTLIARAVTGRGGRPHAAAEVLARAGFEAAGCTLYLTLEPCHHWGRTPPCVDAIIRSGVMRVVIGTTDPDPRTAGGSVAQLASAGIEAVIADHTPSKALHAGHIRRQTTGRPFVTAVLVASADGVIGKGRGVVGGTAAQDFIQILRARSDAILVGAASARSDDPILTVTMPGLPHRSPLRVVLAGASGADASMNLIGSFSGHRTAIIAETSASIDAPVSIETIRVSGHDGRPDIDAAMAALGERRIQNLLVEPGQRLTAALLEGGHIDRFALIETAQTINEPGSAIEVSGSVADQFRAAGLVELDRRKLGDDTLTLFGRPQSPV